VTFADYGRNVRATERVDVPETTTPSSRPET
jgi:hypothetical protein